MNPGYKFEQYCTDLYKRLGKIGVTHNIQYNFRKILTKKLVKKAQVDIEYFGLPSGIMTVECKYHKDVNVGPEEVEAFVETLYLLDRGTGIMMTNREYTSTAAKIAKKNRIRLIDYDRLWRMHRQSNGIAGMIFLDRSKSLDKIIMETRLERGYLNPKIRTQYVLL
jgi:hypothetical protein